MHYCLHLLTKELPTKDGIEKIMQPYNSEIVYGNSDDEDKMINYPILHGIGMKLVEDIRQH